MIPNLDREGFNLSSDGNKSIKISWIHHFAKGGKWTRRPVGHARSDTCQACAARALAVLEPGWTGRAWNRHMTIFVSKLAVIQILGCFANFFKKAPGDYETSIWSFLQKNYKSPWSVLQIFLKKYPTTMKLAFGVLYKKITNPWPPAVKIVCGLACKFFAQKIFSLAYKYLILPLISFLLTILKLFSMFNSL